MNRDLSDRQYRAGAVLGLALRTMVWISLVARGDSAVTDSATS